MGWVFTPGQTKKQLVAYRTRECKGTIPNKKGETVSCRTLRHCFRGVAFIGVLWTVRELTYTKDGKTTRTKKYIGCDLLRYSKRDEGWGYKDMEESMHPYYYSCPLGYLELAPVECEDWRVGVRTYHAEQAKRRKAKAERKRAEQERLKRLAG